MKTIFNEAARKGLAVVSMHSYCGDLPLYTDGYHFREDSQSRRKLIAGIAHGLHLTTAELYAKNAILADRPKFLELQNNHRFDPSGRYLVDSRSLTESLRRLARQKPTQATPTENAAINHDEPNPREDEWFEVKREEVHASMPPVTTEELTAAIEKHQVMRVDQYRWARVDEVDESGRVTKAPRKEEAGTKASSAASASTDVQAISPQEHVWGGSILKTTQTDERAAKRAKKDKRIADLKRPENIAAQGAANLRRWEDCIYYAGDDRRGIARLLELKPVERRGRELHDRESIRHDRRPCEAQDRPRRQELPDGVDQGELHRQRSQVYSSFLGWPVGARNGGP